MESILRSHDVFVTEIVRAQGCYLYDRQERRYVEFESGIWCTALGHNHPRITRAIRDQLDRVMHLNNRYVSDIAVETARRLLEKVGLCGGKCLFLSSGSEAVELGVQSARALTGKPRLLTLSDSYLAAYGSAGTQDPAQWVTLDWTPCRTCDHSGQCDPQCRLLAEIPFEEIGAFVFEPGNASGLVKIPPRAMVRELARAVGDQGGLVVVNDVTTGVGRTGKWFGFQHYDIRPDMVAVGKCIGNGYPVSAAVMTAEVGERLEKQHFHYAQSHQNDPLGCAVAREVIAVIGEEDLIARGRRMGEGLMSELGQMADRHPSIREVRGRGLMIALEFDSRHDPALASRVHQELLEKRILVGCHPGGNLIRFYPPLTIAENDTAYLLENLNQVLAARQ